MSISNRELFERARGSNFEKDPGLLRFILEKKKIEAADDVDSLGIDVFLEAFLKLAKKKWRDANSRSQIMEKKFGYPGGWLSQSADVPDLNPKPKKSTPQNSKDFSELSKSSKNRVTAKLRASNVAPKLVHAAKTALRSEGQNDLAFVIEEAGKSPGRAAKIRRLSGVAESLDEAPRRNISLPSKISAEDGLVHLFQTDQTRDAYIETRVISKSHGADIWPPYADIQAAKKDCRPSNVKYEETAVVVPLSDRLRHNDERLIKIFATRFETLLQDIGDGGTLDVEAEEKIGFDGATGNAIYNQRFSLENRDASDSSLLSTCVVPLQYRTKTGEVIFTNPVPQGSAFCQPVRLEYKKETPEASKEIDAWISAEIAALEFDPIIIPVGSKFVKFNHTLRRTMLDCKAKNAVTDTKSTLRCFICGATSAAFNDVGNVAAKFPTKEENLAYGGICDLHAWLRGFDAINSLSDKLSVKLWKPHKKEDRDQVEARKKLRQDAFREELGLLVDVPRAGGAGNSNTGNVARKAFQNEETFARITEVDERLIHRIHTMLIAINTDHPIDAQAFKAYGFETAKLWVELYGWYNMPVTMHQLFFHAWESLRLSSLPLSFFSEQSLESSNKYFKRDRERHSRKDSRLHTIADQFHRQSDKSDLLIAIKLAEKQKRKENHDLPQDVLDLLVASEVPEED